jgi:Lectin C-type domain
LIFKIFLTVYDPVVNVEHWTSAKDVNNKGNLKWCNGKTSVNLQETNWKGGKPVLADGNCVFVQFSNSTANQTTFSLGDCDQKKKFLCEVI